ncbi:hypothetical protein [Paludisphaera soli]|uniref:hypothetical protein n=1 Tax=Paludisphaera soli TaxID=2712865 RepID=UPI0013EB2AB4|nr:hypothetical protein [Paludisphaera soli]
MTPNGSISTWDARLRGLLRRLRPWFDPRSYRPLILLVVVAFGAFLGPLALDVLVALVYGLPAWTRKAFGQGVMLAILAAGAVRLWTVRPGDAWPDVLDAEARGPATAAERWLPWAIRLAVLTLAYPMLSNPDGLGFSDWDFVLDKFEAARRTILVWGQFPWWNPWSRGGFPLAAEPQIGAISMATPLILALGTTTGLGLSAILCILLAVEGAYRLARLWFRDPWASAAAALVYGLNGGVAVDTAVGYILAMSYCSVPWLAYFAFRIGRRFSDGLAMGFWMAFVMLNGIQYMSLYAIPLTAAIGLRSLRLQPPGRRVALLRHAAAAVGTCLMLCGWRLVPVLLILLDDKRERVTSWDETPASLFHYLTHRPSPRWTAQFSDVLGSVFAELTCYVGPVVLVLALASLLLGWRWWHALALAGFWLAIGSVRWYHPSAWLMSWPLFGSAHVVTRWRFLAMLGLGLAVAAALSRLRGSPRRALRGLAAALAVVIAADFLVLAHQQLPLAFSVRPDPALFPGPPVPEIENVLASLGYPCTLRGYGVIQGYEPMLSYYRNAPTLRLARDDPAYRGEAWTDAGPVRPVSWSPNRLVFQVEPGQAVHVNQNPGSWWWANGRPAFPGLRCAELLTPFVAEADSRGRLVLEIRPRGLAWGIALQVAGCFMLAGAWILHRRAARSARPEVS